MKDEHENFNMGDNKGSQLEVRGDMLGAGCAAVVAFSSQVVVKKCCVAGVKA